MKNVFLSLDMDRVAGIVAALGTYDHVGLLGEHVDNFAFAFVAPLGTH